MITPSLRRELDKVVNSVIGRMNLLRKEENLILTDVFCLLLV